MKNYYTVLGVARNATRSDIRKAYLQKAKLYHPDLNSSPSAPSRFKEIQEAYNTLYDAKRRKEYDTASVFNSGTTSSYNASQNYRDFSDSSHASESFEEQFRAEAERLRRQWERMEQERIRMESQGVNVNRIFEFGNFVPLGGFRFIGSFKYLFHLLNRILPLILVPLGIFFYVGRNDTGPFRRRRSNIHVVYDSYGRAYTFDAHGRRYRFLAPSIALCRIPEFDRR